MSSHAHVAVSTAVSQKAATTVQNTQEGLERSSKMGIIDACSTGMSVEKQALSALLVIL